ncbi:hypothetical protein LY39_03711 [Roseinatronobacter bogoriensis subsp. barguzinensis]|nr:hypothetical protein [Rhodobaca bogoriensis DSM 18756]TDW32643.1 hypothetical protein LY39_03711 [Rhodobaca barguzinensis]TDY65674.1 hypothetical protein EV660_11821 [Rhodobaca bogoriensis DSM 18756]
MGQDEDPEPLVRRTDFCRAEQTRRRRVAHAPKLSQDGFKPEGDVPGDVFEKDPFGAAFPDDAGDIGPEVAGIIGAAAFSGRAEGLAGISGEDDVEGPAEGAGVEGPKVRPDRRRCEIPCALRGDEDSAGPILPFDEAACVISGLGEHEAHIEATAACAEGEAVPGTKHHAIHRTPRSRSRSTVTRPRSSIASRMLLLIVFAGRNRLELTRSA